MGVYDRQIAAAKRMIAKYGEKCVWNANGSEVAADPSKPWATTDASTTNYPNTTIAWFPMNEQTRKRLQYSKDSEVPTGSFQGYMPQVAFNPSLKDTITKKDGTILRIYDIDPIDPNGEGAILYTITVYE